MERSRARLRERTGPEFGRVFKTASVFAALLQGLAAPAHGQPPCGSENLKWSGLEYDDLSGRVHGVLAYREAESGTGQLCVLVLWRGEAGWYDHRERVMDALRNRGLLREDPTGHPDSVEPGGDTPWPTYGRDLGDIYIGFDYDWERHRLRILGQEIELGPSNVVLIDSVDAIDGASRIVSILRIDPALDSGKADMSQIVSRSAEVEAFVRQ